MPKRKGTQGSGGGGADEVSDVRAILAADIHLQTRPPIARSEEPDWWGAMARPLKEIWLLANKHDAPVIYAGDIFDKWNASPELINFAIENLPCGFAVAGQHDLPNHNYDEIRRSAYWTLVKAGIIHNIRPGETINTRTFRNDRWDLWVTGWPWGFDPKPPEQEKGLRVAAIHKFIWTNNTGYHGAPEEDRIPVYKKKLKGYDAALFGDNHIGFDRVYNGTSIFNCGSIMRRHTDQADYWPGVGLLHANGTVTRHYLDTSEDVLIETTKAEEAAEKLLDMTAFVEELRGLDANDALNFVVALERFLRDNKVAGRVARVVLEAAGM